MSVLVIFAENLELDPELMEDIIAAAEFVDGAEEVAELYGERAILARAELAAVQAAAESADLDVERGARAQAIADRKLAQLLRDNGLVRTATGIERAPAVSA